MPRTAVGLYANSELADQVARDLEAGGIPRADVRVLSEPPYMAITGSISSPRHHFQVSLYRDLETIGATGAEATTYVEGVQEGGVLVFASGRDEWIDAAAAIMNRGGPAHVEELTGGDLNLPNPVGQGKNPARSRAIYSSVYMRVV